MPAPWRSDASTGAYLGNKEDVGDHDDELDRTRLRIEQLRRRSLELLARNQQLIGDEKLSGSSPDQVRLAAEHAEQARANAAAAQARASRAYLRSAAAHEAAAERHEILASCGFGDVEEHLRRAREHREMSAADRAAGDLAGQPPGLDISPGDV